MREASYKQRTIHSRFLIDLGTACLISRPWFLFYARDRPILGGGDTMPWKLAPIPIACYSVEERSLSSICNHATGAKHALEAQVKVNTASGKITSLNRCNLAKELIQFWPRSNNVSHNMHKTIMDTILKVFYGYEHLKPWWYAWYWDYLNFRNAICRTDHQDQHRLIINMNLGLFAIGLRYICPHCIPVFVRHRGGVVLWPAKST